MLQHAYAVIMAGGGGTRLWPLSRQARPKQMVSLRQGRSLFQMAVDRLDGLFPPDCIYVVTIPEQAAQLQAQAPQIPVENFLLEPMPRGTASVVGYAAVVLQQRDPQARMAVLTADHFIADLERFHRLLRAAFLAADKGWLVTLGIEPTHPATGYGYIQIGENLDRLEELPIQRALRFREKPNAELAAQFLAGGDHAWNSGMFVWNVGQILEEFARQMPDLYAGLQRMAADWGTPAFMQTTTAVWQDLKSQTIDYGIMEGAAQVAVIPAGGLGWKDVGSWDSLYEVLPADESGNIVYQSQHLGLDTHNTLVFGENSGRLVVTIGVDDLVVVESDDVIMICKKDQAQQVRKVVDQLKSQGEQYL